MVGGAEKGPPKLKGVSGDRSMEMSQAAQNVAGMLGLRARGLAAMPVRDVVNFATASLDLTFPTGTALIDKLGDICKRLNVQTLWTEGACPPDCGEECGRTLCWTQPGRPRPDPEQRSETMCDCEARRSPR